MSKSKKIGKTTVKPGWMPLNDGLHPFQDRMADTGSWSADTLLVEAPTGSGKTYGFIELAKRNVKDKFKGKLLVVEPTRLLSRQVQEDFEDEGFEPDMIDAKSISKARFENENKYDVVKEMLNNSKSDVIITNPVQLSMILHNFYSGDTEDGLFKLRRSFPVIAIDEWHCYDLQQSAHILATHVLLSLNNDVKFLYTSATPPEDSDTILKGCGLSVDSIKAKLKNSKPSGDSRKVRGRIDLDVYDKDSLAWVKSNISELKDGRWIIVFDELRKLSKAYEMINKKYPDESTILSGFHREDKKFPTPMDYEWDDRIVLATNILELGTNPPTSTPKAYENLVIDPGFGWTNTIQRFGRMGRNGLDANVHLCREGVVDDVYPKGKVDKLIEKGDLDYHSFLSWCVDSESNIFSESPLKPERVGVHIGVILDRLKKNSVSKLVKKQIGNKSILKGIKLFQKANAGVEDFPIDDYSTSMGSLYQWWNDYKSSLAYFIKPGEEKEITHVAGSDEIVVKYDSDWIEENTKEQNEKRIFREKKNTDFSVTARGVPFTEERKLVYSTYKYEAREEVLTSFYDALQGSSGAKSFFADGENALDKLKEALEPLIKLTASKNRLIIKEEHRGPDNILL